MSLHSFEHFALGMSKNWKGFARKLKPVQRSSELTSNMRMSPERGHHLKHESVWRTRGTTWGGGGGARRAGGDAETRRRTLLWLSPLSSWLSVNAENWESAASARARWRKSLPRLTLLYPGTSLQGSCCHGHWMKVCEAQWCGSAVPSHWTLSGFF